MTAPVSVSSEFVSPWVKAPGLIGLASLANAELHLVIAELLSKYEIKVWNTTEEDMEWCDTGAVRPKGRFQVILEKRA